MSINGKYLKLGIFTLLITIFPCHHYLSFEIPKNNLKVYEWGFFAHKKINRHAVFSLPPPLIQFYKKNIAFIEREAVAPDSRRHSDENEAPRHFIDLDNYPDSLKNKGIIKYSDAIATFGENHIEEHGIVPFHIKTVYRKLVHAWKSNNKSWVLRLSADIGHYIGDSNVPLHTTSNYDGQQTGQEGIHSFWETILVEKYHENFNLWVGKAKYIANKDSAIWSSITIAHNRVNIVLMQDKLISKSMAGKDFSFMQKGTKIKKTKSDAFIKEYYKSMDGMVEDAFRNSILLTASFWYSAWVDAGSPAL